MRRSLPLPLCASLLAACGGAEATSPADAPLSFSAPEIQWSPPFRLRFPIHGDDRHRITSLWVIGQDHDGVKDGTKTACVNYAGMPSPLCYDAHNGTDFILIGAFQAMDLVDTRVVAAAPGVVEAVVDGHYDRCHATLPSGEVSCDGHPKEANRVVIRHDNGWSTRYLHLKRNSVAVAVGQRVACGDVLGLVGSSGNSAMPHLHLSLHDPNGRLVDPYAGPRSQATSYWVEQDAGDGLPSGRCASALGGLDSCSLQTIEDPALCGTETVTSATECGTELVTSAASCGSDTITSATACGTEVVTSASRCGTELVTSATRCGVETLTGLWACASRGLEGLFTCQVPKSCSVPKSCTVPKSCSVPRTCAVPAACEIPASCEVLRCQ